MRKLKKTMQKKKVGVTELAKNVGVSRVSIYNYQNEIKTPNAKIAIKIANYLGVKVEELM